MTGLTRNDQDFVDGQPTERLYRAISHFLGVGLLIGPILLGVWFASTAIENVKPLEPLPPPRIAPLPPVPSESMGALPLPADASAVNLATDRQGAARMH